MTDSTPQVSNVDEQLKIILAEYNALRAEILQRSSAQSRIAEFHITILTGIIGAAVLHPDASPWLLLLVPIEASLFGTWYIDHGIFIAKLGGYIHEVIEQTVKKLCGVPVLSWESSLKEASSLLPTWRHSLLAQLAFLPFAAPSLLALVMSIGVIFVPSFGSLLRVPQEFYQGRLQWTLFLGWIVSLAFFCVYVSWAVRWYRPPRIRANNPK